MLDPLSTALKQITETRDLVERLIISSESFDYPQAKLVLERLQKQVRELAKLQAKYQQLDQMRDPNICLLDFRADTKSQPTS
jgi:hypothetical protein